MWVSRKLMSFLVKVDPLNVVSVLEATVYVMVGSLTFPFDLRVVWVCVVPFVLKVDIELVNSISLLLWLLPDCVVAGFGRSTITFFSGKIILVKLLFYSVISNYRTL